MKREALRQICTIKFSSFARRKESSKGGRSEVKGRREVHQLVFVPLKSKIRKFEQPSSHYPVKSSLREGRRSSARARNVCSKKRKHTRRSVGGEEAEKRGVALACIKNPSKSILEKIKFEDAFF